MRRRMATPAPRWQRLEKDERREQILLCARKLLSERPASTVSMTEIARTAGVTRGLLNHYFGTKRELELEVVRQMVHVPDPPTPGELEGRTVREVVAEFMDDWLEMVSRNRAAWFSALGAEGFGSDPEIEAILEEAREAAATRLITPFLAADASLSDRQLRPILRAYSALAEATTREWLQRRRLTRAQASLFLTESLLSLVHDVAPRVHTKKGS